MLPWGSKLLAMYGLIVVTALIVHNAVQAYKHRAKETYAFRIILLIPMFVYFVNII